MAASKPIQPPSTGHLVQDDSGHWYFIPEGKRQEFDDWCSEMEDTGVSNRASFDRCRLGMHPSNYVFTLRSEED